MVRMESAPAGGFAPRTREASGHRPEDTTVRCARSSAGTGGRPSAAPAWSGPERFEIPIEISLFRSPDCRNEAADELWASLQAE